eukprot:GHUV01016118.1.p1 GENE.GHUV01016118.1~~GHUV01016118.1.p1  ORF type:complete len:468 (+),score=148.03 GHUV01016118.1:207-1610(+)
MEEQPAVDITQKLDRPARKQVPGPVTSDKADTRTGEVNIWSGRRVGPRTDGSSKGEKRIRQPSKYRCCVATDAGKTRGSEGQINQFCLFFAKGMCYQGYSCTYLHRVPTSADNAAMYRNTSQDIFGREKMPDHLDNRKGAGSYDRDMTTLYVNYGGAGHYATPQLRHLLVQNFGEFGSIKRVYIVPSKTIAFVTFHWRASAEFAKEAMDSQTLTGSTMNEVLSVRWANEDPNPVAVIGRKRDALDAAEAAALAAWDAMPPEEKKARLALMHQAQARKITAVADRMPEPLLSAAEDGLLQGSSRQQFDDYRGVPKDPEQQEGGQEQQLDRQEVAVHEQADRDALASGGVQSEQQEAPLEQQGHTYDNWQHEAHWGQYPPEYLEQWQAYYQRMEQQPQQQVEGNAAEAAGGAAWYQGWRQRQKPAELVAAEAQQSAAGEPNVATAAQEESEAAVAGLLADYGSESVSSE